MSESLKDQFITAYGNIKREGAAALLDYLQQSDFFTAPASTRFHGSYESGLLEHSLNVYKRLVQLNEGEGNIATLESVAISSLLHDVCKIGLYVPEKKSRKTDQLNSYGKPVWEDYMGYGYQDNLPYGHGEKSVYMVSGYMKLTREEAFAIRWHMGAYDASVQGGQMNTLSEAFELYPLAAMTHLADMMATHLDERKKEKT